MLKEHQKASCEGWWGLWLGVLAKQTGSGPSEARCLPVPNQHLMPLIRIRSKSPPPVPSRESDWGCPKQECRAQGRGSGWNLASGSFPERGSSFLALGLRVSPTRPFPDILVSLTAAFPRQCSGWPRPREPSVKPQREALGPEAHPSTLSYSWERVEEAPTEPPSFWWHLSVSPPGGGFPQRFPLPGPRSDVVSSDAENSPWPLPGLEGQGECHVSSSLQLQLDLSAHHTGHGDSSIQRSDKPK